MITCTRIIEWDSGHRVHGHEGKCSHLHGHRYKAELTATAECEECEGKGYIDRRDFSTVIDCNKCKKMGMATKLDDIGRVVDFGVLKGRVGKWVDTYWDHWMLLWEKDPLTEKMNTLLMGQLTITSFNPTAEHIADHLLRVVGPSELEGTGVKLVKVRVWETPNCWAEATL